jgi:uncharacterized protein YndB with AHSA1/START domain
MTERSVAHGSFTLERVYDASPARVYAAFATEQAKEAWFSGPSDEWEPVERRFDFRVGGSERAKGRWRNGVVSTFDAVYFDVVPNERIVYAYEMHIDDRKISVSLASIEIKPEGAGTRLTVTEHGAFLDGYDDAGSREHGTGLLLDQLGKSLSVEIAA